MTEQVPLAEQIRERAWRRAKERSLSLGIEEFELRRAVVEEIEQLLKNHAHAVSTRDEALQRHEHLTADLAAANERIRQLREDFQNASDAADTAGERIARLEGALREIRLRAQGDGLRTFDKATDDLMWIDDECRALLPPTPNTAGPQE